MGGGEEKPGGEMPSAPATADVEALIHEFARTRDPRLREWLILHHQRLVHAIAAHRASTHFKELGAALGPFMAGRAEVEMLDGI